MSICIVPPAPNIGLSDLRITIIRDEATLSGITRYRYSKSIRSIMSLIFSIVSPFVIDFKEPLNITSDEFALGIGESIIVGWDPHDLTEGLISVNDITVNIAIVCYMIQYTY